MYVTKYDDMERLEAMVSLVVEISYFRAEQVRISTNKVYFLSELEFSVNLLCFWVIYHKKP